MNRYYQEIQNAIGLTGDQISREHQLTRALADLRELPDEFFEDPKKADMVEFILKRAAKVLGIPREAFNAPYEDVER